jgi:hypothetical protein
MRDKGYTKKKLLDKMKEVYEEKGKISSSVFDKHAEPNSETVRKYFGSWQKAKDKVLSDEKNRPSFKNQTL